jgi:hypothetical protein
MGWLSNTYNRIKKGFKTHGQKILSGAQAVSDWYGKNLKHHVEKIPVAGRLINKGHTAIDGAIKTGQAIANKDWNGAVQQGKNVYKAVVS